MSEQYRVAIIGAGRPLRTEGATGFGMAHAHTRGITNLVECEGSGAEPELSGRKALQTSEVIFATYESSRRHGRVDLPRTTDDNAFHALQEEGVWGT